MTRAAHQVLPALHPGDAVGNEALLLRAALRAAGWQSEIFAGWTDPALARLSGDLAAFAAAARADTVTLFHFGPGPAAAAVAAAPGRCLLRYHNVTPAELLAEHAPRLARSCARARTELSRLRPRCEAAVAVSDFNSRELDTLGFTATSVVPLLLDPDRLRVRAPVVERLYRDGRSNLLAVGRLAPNKRLDDVIAAFAVFQRLFDPRSRLLVAGSADGLEEYAGHLSATARRLRAERVVFTGHVDDAELGALFAVADALVCLSEHEGFGAPLVEAMALGVPVVAFAAGAVEQTLGGAGVLLRDKRPELVAGALDALRRDARLRRAVVEGQRRRAAAHGARAAAAALVERVERLAASSAPRGIA